MSVRQLDFGFLTILPACSFGGTDAFIVILEGKISRAADGGKLSAVLPSEGVA